MFSLPQSLPKPTPVTHSHYHPLYPTDGQVSNDTVANFVQRSQISFLIQPTGRRWWVPSRSFLRVRFRLDCPVGATTAVGGIGKAPVLGASPCAALFRGARFMIGTQEISKINNFLPQINAIKLRTTRPGAYLRDIESKRSGFVSCPYAASGDGKAQKGDAGAYRLTNLYTQELYKLADANGAEIVDNDVGTDELYYTPRPSTMDESWQHVSRPAQGSNQSVLGPLTTGILPQNAMPVYTPVAGSVAGPTTYEYEFDWTPPLGIFDHQGALPGADYRLEFHPQPDALKDLLINTLATPVAATGEARTLSIVNMEFHVCEVEGPRGDDSKFVLDIADWQLTPRGIEAKSSGDEDVGAATPIQESYTLPMATESVAFAMVNLNKTEKGYGPQFFYDRATVGAFTTNGTAIVGGPPPTAEFVIPEYHVWESEIKNRQSPFLTPFSQYYIEYGGRKRPLRTPEIASTLGVYPHGCLDTSLSIYADTGVPAKLTADAETTRPVVDRLLTEWQRCHHQTGLWFAEGGCETYDEWLSRGPFFFFRWPRDGTNNSTRLNFFAQTKQALSGLGNTAQPYLGMFTLARKGVRVTTSGSRVLNVEVSNRTKRA